MPIVRSIAGSIVRPLPAAITGLSGGAAPVVDAYAANGFSPDFVADESLATPYYRVAGVDSDYDTVYTSDTTAGGLVTQTDSSGNLVWGPHNLEDNSLDVTGETANSVSFVANQGDDSSGATTLDRVNSGFADVRIRKWDASLPSSLSIKWTLVFQTRYIDQQWIQVLGRNNGSYFANIDLQNGVVGNVGAETSASVSDLGGGLLEWTVEFGPTSGTATPGPSFYMVDSSSAGYGASSAGTSGDYQIGVRRMYRSDLGGMAPVLADQRYDSSLADFVETSGTARYLIRRGHYRYNGTSYVPTLLHEPVGATNGLTYSKPDTTNWTDRTAGNMTITENDAAGWDGNTSATTLTESAVADQWYMDEGVSSSTGLRVMWAVVRLVSGSRLFQIRPGGLGTGIAWANFSLTGAGSVDSSGGTELDSAGIKKIDASRYLCWMAANYSSSPTSMNIVLSNASSELPIYTGDAGVTLAVDHCQIEDGALPSSPIPTTGTAVTRAADTRKYNAAAIPASTTAMSGFVSGRISYVDENAAAQANFIDADPAGAARLHVYANTAGAGDASIVALTNNGSAVFTSANRSLGFGVDVPFKVAFRASSTAINYALNGVSATEGTGTGILPDISTTDLKILAEENNQIDVVSWWDANIADAGTEEATA